jgi:putative transposase
MIERDGEVSVKRQAELLDLSRSSVYYVARSLPERDLKLMRILDELHLKWPFYGARKLTRELQNQGHEVGRRHVTTLMRRMGMETIYRKPRTSIPAPLSAVYPYLLTGLKIERPNHVWAADLTYLPMAHGFQYLVAIIDVGSRKTLSWRVSNTMTPDFCVEALQEALGKYGKPEIFNTDQGSQFTCGEWIDTLKAAGVQISMDGKGRWIDNVFIERLWRLCAQGRYVAGSAGCSGFTVDARTMRAHNEPIRNNIPLPAVGQRSDCHAGTILRLTDHRRPDPRPMAGPSNRALCRVAGRTGHLERQRTRVHRGSHPVQPVRASARCQRLELAARAG